MPNPDLAAELREDLWAAINDYAYACSGDPSKRVYSNLARMNAVTTVERALNKLLAATELERAGGWVAIRDGLPPPNDLVLVRCGDRNTLVWSFPEPERDLCAEQIGAVTHWRHLPPAPEPDRTEGA